MKCKETNFNTVSFAGAHLIASEGHAAEFRMLFDIFLFHATCKLELILGHRVLFNHRD